jgi:hypothetical protein
VLPELCLYNACARHLQGYHAHVPQKCISRACSIFALLVMVAMLMIVSGCSTFGTIIYSRYADMDTKHATSDIPCDSSA